MAKINYRKIFAILGISSLVLISACGGNGDKNSDNNKTKKETTTTETTTIKEKKTEKETTTEAETTTSDNITDTTTIIEEVLETTSETIPSVVSQPETIEVIVNNEPEQNYQEDQLESQQEQFQEAQNEPEQQEVPPNEEYQEQPQEQPQEPVEYQQPETKNYYTKEFENSELSKQGYSYNEEKRCAYICYNENGYNICKYYILTLARGLERPFYSLDLGTGFFVDTFSNSIESNRVDYKENMTAAVTVSREEYPVEVMGFVVRYVVNHHIGLTLNPFSDEDTYTEIFMRDFYSEEKSNMSRPDAEVFVRSIYRALSLPENLGKKDFDGYSELIDGCRNLKLTQETPY